MVAMKDITVKWLQLNKSLSTGCNKTQHCQLVAIKQITVNLLQLNRALSAGCI